MIDVVKREIIHSGKTEKVYAGGHHFNICKTTGRSAFFLDFYQEKNSHCIDYRFAEGKKSKISSLSVKSNFSN